MGEWIRNKRRTNGFPRGLEGKKVEARLRNGDTFFGIVGKHGWLTECFFNTADGSSRDVMAYRILEDDPALADADGWIEWHGGKCPVAKGTLVDVKYRDGDKLTSLPANKIIDQWPDASESFWMNSNHHKDIIAYRLSQPDWPEDRVDVIGQNGNTGEHYGKVCAASIPDELIVEKLAGEEAKAQRIDVSGQSTNKYQRAIKGVTIDVYDVLVAFGVTCPAMAHAIKKMLMPGQRGNKDAEQDKREAIQAIERSIELHKEENNV